MSAPSPHPKLPNLGGPTLLVVDYEDYPNTQDFDAFLQKLVHFDKLASAIASLTER